MDIKPRQFFKAASPQEKTFRKALKQDEQASKVVDQVEVVLEAMEDLNEGKHDSAKESPNVAINAETGTIRTGIGSIFNGPLEDIARQAPAPEGDQDAIVWGFKNEQTMSVGVEYSSNSGQYTLALHNKPDGSKIYTSGADRVTMNPDGTYTLTSES